MPVSRPTSNVSASEYVATWGDGPVRQVLIEMHGFPIRLRRVIVPHDGNELMHVGGHEGVCVLKPFAARPAVEGADLGDFVERRVIPLAERVVDLALFLEVRVAAGHQRGPRR